MTDAPAFYDYAQQELAKLMAERAKVLVAGNFPDFAAYKHAAGTYRGLTEAAESFKSSYKSVIENVKPNKVDDAGRKSEERKW